MKKMKKVKTDECIDSQKRHVVESQFTEILNNYLDVLYRVVDENLKTPKDDCTPKFQEICSDLLKITKIFLQLKSLY